MPNLKPSVTSKINWTQVVGAIAMLGTFFGLDLTPEHQAAIVLAIGLATQLVTLVSRTWFTTSMTVESAKVAGLL